AKPCPGTTQIIGTLKRRSGRAKWQEPFQQPQAGPKGEGHGCPESLFCVPHNHSWLPSFF
ncbi:hypothetical protein, partial [Thalassolituus sp. UBA2009]|uniref:hypothetical protein n=1 Tax=Thalassolituus sp. UBA2009 TaxID=1947658 RepID=UPI00257D5C75